MIVENLIIENEKNIKEIQNILNNNLNIINNNIGRKNINSLNHNNYEIIDVNNFDPNEQQIIKNIVVKSISQYSNYKDSCKNIYENCSNLEEGTWIIAVGENIKYSICTNVERKLAVNFGNSKIIILK